MYNSLFSKTSIDNQLLKAQMDIAKLELHEDFSYNNLKSIINFSKYPLFYKLLKFSLTTWLIRKVMRLFLQKMHNIWIQIF